MQPTITEESCEPHTRVAAQALYEAYTANSGNLNFQGNPCPTWPDLPPAIRGNWCAVAIAAARLH